MKKSVKYASILLRAALIFLACRVLAGGIPELSAQFDLGSEWGLRNLISAIFPYDLLELLLAAAALLAVARAPGPPLRFWERFYVCVVSALWLLGYAFNATDSWQILFGSAVRALLALTTYLGLTALTSTALRWLKEAVRRFQSARLRLPGPMERHPFLFSWAVIFLCWLPFVCIRYPAGIEFDAYYQMEQFLGFRPMTAHWPPFSSALMGSFVWLGKTLFGSWDVGVFSFVLFQALVSSAILAYTVAAMGELGVGRGWRLASLAVYAVATVYPGYLTAVLKDALFSAVTVLYVTLLALCLLSRPSPRRCAALGATALLMCLLRNNGAYVLIPCTLVLLLWTILRRRRSWIPLVAALAAACVLNAGCQKLLLPALDIPSGSVAEALSVPFQQTARYVRDFPEDVTGSEREAIAAVLDYDALPAIYDPDLSDPVKNTYHGESGDLVRYLGVWLRQFFRHPGVYFEATLANSCGFYYPNARNLVFYADTRNYDQLIFHEPEALKPLKNLLYDYVALFESVPGLMLIGNAGFNTWLTAFFVLLTLSRRDKRRLFLLLPSVLGVLICVAGPTYTVNGVRYILPVIYTTPLLAGLCVFTDSRGGPESAPKKA